MYGNISDDERARIIKLNDADRSTEIAAQLHRIHVGVFDGSADKAAVEDALVHLDALTTKLQGGEPVAKPVVEAPAPFKPTPPTA